MCCARRRRRVVVVRRQVTCGVTVPIAENDELQREHERAEQETSDYLTPSYTPRAEPWEGVTQGSTMMSPPTYSRSPAANQLKNITLQNVA